MQSSPETSALCDMCSIFALCPLCKQVHHVIILLLGNTVSMADGSCKWDFIRRESAAKCPFEQRTSPVYNMGLFTIRHIHDYVLVNMTMRQLKASFVKGPVRVCRSTPPPTLPCCVRWRFSWRSGWHCERRARQRHSSAHGATHPSLSTPTGI